MKRFLRECGRLLSTGSFMEKSVVIAGLGLIPGVAFRYPHLRSEGFYGAVMFGTARKSLARTASSPSAAIERAITTRGFRWESTARCLR
jgi:hypothetical protein